MSPDNTTFKENRTIMEQDQFLSKNNYGYYEMKTDPNSLNFSGSP